MAATYAAWDSNVKLEQAMKNPGGAFASPEALEVSTEFTAAQKGAILTQWQDQLTSLLVADEEGMPREDAAAYANLGRNADCLRRVTDVISRLSR
jgi:hypothetical protein